MMTSLSEVEETEDIIPIRTIELTNEKPKLVVGRASANKNRNLRAAPDNGLVFNGVMSRNHATIEFNAENQKLTITDDSTHGTTLNKKSLTRNESAPLEDNDVVQFGRTVKRSGDEDVIEPATFRLNISHYELDEEPRCLCPPSTTSATASGTFRVPSEVYNNTTDDEDDNYSFAHSEDSDDDQSGRPYPTVEETSRVTEYSARLPSNLTNRMPPSEEASDLEDALIRDILARPRCEPSGSSDGDDSLFETSDRGSEAPSELPIEKSSSAGRGDSLNIHAHYPASNVTRPSVTTPAAVLQPADTTRCIIPGKEDFLNARAANAARLDSPIFPARAPITVPATSLTTSTPDPTAPATRRMFTALGFESPRARVEHARYEFEWRSLQDQAYADALYRHFEGHGEYDAPPVARRQGVAINDIVNAVERDLYACYPPVRPSDQSDLERYFEESIAEAEAGHPERKALSPEPSSGPRKLPSVELLSQEFTKFAEQHAIAPQKKALRDLPPLSEEDVFELPLPVDSIIDDIVSDVKQTAKESDSAPAPKALTTPKTPLAAAAAPVVPATEIPVLILDAPPATERAQSPPQQNNKRKADQLEAESDVTANGVVINIGERPMKKAKTKSGTMKIAEKLAYVALGSVLAAGGTFAVLVASAPVDFA